MAIIHMETDLVRDFSKQFGNAVAEMHDLIVQLKNKTHATDWQGVSRDDFMAEFDRLTDQIILRTEDGLYLSQRVAREVDEWEEGASKLSGSPPPGTAYAPADVGLPIIGKYQEDWYDLSVEERKEWISTFYEWLCKKYNITPGTLNFSNIWLPNAAGNQRPGVPFLEDPSIITIDTDSMDTGGQSRFVHVVAHEFRHQMQRHLVDHPDQRPPDVSLEQIAEWRENFKIFNYKRSIFDYDAYDQQPVEADADSFADSILRDLLHGDVITWRNKPVP